MILLSTSLYLASQQNQAIQWRYLSGFNNETEGSL